MTEVKPQEQTKTSIQQKIEATLTHNGYDGSAQIDPSGVFFGKIKNINDLVSYEASSTEGLLTAFIAAVDDYVETCNKLGASPNIAVN
ncbi:hypothetical protein YA0089_24860 [Pseudomonas viridiflava]|uniref:hypothetical protein n=1 Tax=Pseudomonas viridiflava TaxID=33069 RepID=UPI0018E5F3D9|nr:hypothetical protein [Pseudomonas viridiflava]MBI6726846.1 hypothetical protein [Pseudomonas viridiflava]